MLEDIVLLETRKSLPKSKEVFKYKFSMGGEFDMVVADIDNLTCKIYEVKHSDKIAEKQTRYLLDEEKCRLLEFSYGRIVSKTVIYRGESKKVGGIQYKNIEEFLTEL